MTLEIPVAFFAGIIALIFWIIISCVTKQIRSKKILISLFILYMTVVVSIQWRAEISKYTLNNYTIFSS